MNIGEKACCGKLYCFHRTLLQHTISLNSITATPTLEKTKKLRILTLVNNKTLIKIIISNGDG